MTESLMLRSLQEESKDSSSLESPVRSMIGIEFVIVSSLLNSDMGNLCNLFKNFPI